jgi:hypothetical protein
LKFNFPAIGQFTALLILNITNAFFQLALIPLLIQGIKELRAEVREIRKTLGDDQK